MNDIKVCLATNWWQLWLHWRLWQISRVPEVVHWRGSLWRLWQISRVPEVVHWRGSLWRLWQISRVPEVVHWRGVFVVAQCMRQYTENSPGCSTAEHKRGRQEAIHYTVLETPSCQMNHNWPYPYHNWPYGYTDYSTPSPVNQSLSVFMQSPTHIECSSGFLSQEITTDTFSFCRAKFKQFFPLSISLERVASSLVKFQNVFLLIASVVNTDASTWLLPSDLFRICLQT